jgi:homoserine kinase
VSGDRPGRVVRVTAPATSANLGPGFDSLALALTISDGVRMEVAGSGLGVTVSGAGADELPRDESHLVVSAMRAAFEAMGAHPSGVRLSCANSIPQGCGLGSSAAAIVTGVLGARALVDCGADRLDDHAVLDLAARLDGHPDNVAACLLGGLTVAWTDEQGTGAMRRDVRRRVTVFVPPQQLATSTARSVLPVSVAHADAARNAGRAALLVAALTARATQASTLLAATEDWLHHVYRATVMPQSLDLVRRLRASGLPAVLSGAGPSVLVLAADGVDDLDDTPLAVATRWGVPTWQVHRLAVEPQGARVARNHRE